MSHSSVNDEKLSKAGSIESVPEIDPAAEEKLVRKLDIRLLPIVTVCYLLLFLDRTNIGNAKSAGLDVDLGLGTYDFNIGTSLYYVLFIVLEVPFALSIKRFGFRLVPYSVIAFGLVTLFSAWMESRAGFYLTRVFLGISEAFGFPGISYFLTRYYRRSEITLRIGTFMLFSAGLSGSFGGLLAGGLLDLGHVGSLTGWRVIFLVEGIITVGFGIIFSFIFPTDPETTSILTEEERALQLARMKADQPAIQDLKEPMSLNLIKRGFTSVTTLVCVWLYIVDNLSVQGLAIFLPSILKLNFPGSSIVRIQLLAVPCFVCATIVGLITTWLCIRFKVHWPFCFFGGILTVIGYSIWIATDSSQVSARYAACFLNISGGFINGPVVMGWAASNASPDTVRAMTGAVVTGLGGIGSIAGVWAYVQTDAATGFRAGNSFNLACACSLCVGCVSLMLWQRWENHKRATGKRDYRLQKDTSKLGNLHPSFRLIH